MKSYTRTERSDVEFRRLTQSLVERAMELRSNAYLSHAKHMLLMQTIMSVSLNKKNLMRSNQQLKELDRIKTIFIASMSHEIRNPLTTIIGYSDMVIKGYAGPLTDKQQDYLQNVITSAEFLKDLVSDAMDIAKIDSNVLEAQIESFLLGDVLNDAFAQVAHMAKEKPIELTLDIRDKVEMHSDRRRLLQCLINLLTNAIKYTEHGHIVLAVTCEGDQVNISVSDTGVGLSAKDLQHLFEAFRRGDSAERTRAIGSGIGLFLTNKIVQQVLKGRISVESEIDTGSKFTLVLPSALDYQVL